MREVKELFKAYAESLWETMMSHGGTAGFLIPDYQRTYDWSHDKIGRLLEDCANGFFHLTKSKESFTFLGTLILIKERSEPTFDGTSLTVVDGQQRLTTLLLINCALIERILNNINLVENLPKVYRNWIIKEAELQLNELFNCIVGQLPGRGTTHIYPRIIRHVDNRAKEYFDADYQSIVSQFFMKFSEYYQKEEKEFAYSPRDANGTVKRFKSNFEYIREQIKYISDPQVSEAEIDCEKVKCEDFQRRGFRPLFKKLELFEKEPERDTAISDISNNTDVNVLIRLILFSSYMINCVVLTRVETDDDNSAFDIFDALNTTGEPLTAIETFKPRVIQFENDKGRYEKSASEQAFNSIEEELNRKFNTTDKRQRETKEIVVSFALYADGTKESKELSAQRRYLRTRFDKIKDKHNRIQFVQNLADIATFRDRYWDKNSIPRLVSYHSVDDVDNLQLCFRFISDMNTSLALPVLARYWAQFNKTNNDTELISAAKAVTAFIVIRRSVTGHTRGIDSDFRSLMSKENKDCDPLCIGLDFKNQLPSVDELKTVLRSFLQAEPIGVIDRKSWVEKVSNIGVADYSRPLSKFLILAAANYARPDSDRPGLLTRVNLRRSDEQHYLTYDNWTSDIYKTVEHIAPDSNPGSGWDGSIYRRPETRHSIGNLTLLPQEENSSAGNSGWPRKKIFYLALAEKEHSAQESYFSEAKKQGFQFPKNTQELLKNGQRLHLLDSICNVESWDEELIQLRTKNLLFLAWDTIEPWLFK